VLKRLFFFAIFLFTSSVCLADDIDAQAPINKENRIRNVNNKNCAFNSIEMLARRGGETKLFGISEKFEGPVNQWQIDDMLKKSGVRYKLNSLGNKNHKVVYEFLVIPCQYEKRGVAISLEVTASVCHMVNVVHYDIEKKIVAIIDNADPKLEIKLQDWDTFHRRWNGMAVVIYPDKDPFDRYEAVWR
jgi:hypothetical protein